MSLPTRLIYGKGRASEAGAFLKEYTDSILFVYGGGSVKKTGLYDTVVNSLKENNIAFKELSGVPSNPDIAFVRKGIAIVKENNISFIFGVGGGSVIDVCKAIAAGALYDGDPWDFFSGTRINAALPVGDILTIPGTGSESSLNTVISNNTTKEKVGIASRFLRPVFSIMDPELCVTIPKHAIASPVFDMLSHTMERYFSETEHTDTTDGIAKAVMRSIIKNGTAAYEDPSDVDAWGELMLASDYSHNELTGFGKKHDWANHGMEEVISGIYGIPHGAGLAVVTLAWMKYVYEKHIPIFVQFAVNVMGIRGHLHEPKRVAEDGIKALEKWVKGMNLPTHLSEFNITDEYFELMAERACSYHRRKMIGSLEELKPEDIVNIYRIAQ